MTIRSVLGLGVLALMLAAAVSWFGSGPAIKRQLPKALPATLVLTATRTTWDGAGTPTPYVKRLTNRALVRKLLADSRALKLASIPWVTNGEPAQGWGPRLTVVVTKGKKTLVTIVDTGQGGAKNPLVLVDGHAVVQSARAYLHALYSALHVNRTHLLDSGMGVPGADEDSVSLR